MIILVVVITTILLFFSTFTLSRAPTINTTIVITLYYHHHYSLSSYSHFCSSSSFVIYVYCPSAVGLGNILTILRSYYDYHCSHKYQVVVSVTSYSFLPLLLVATFISLLSPAIDEAILVLILTFTFTRRAVLFPNIGISVGTFLTKASTVTILIVMILPFVA